MSPRNLARVAAPLAALALLAAAAPASAAPRVTSLDAIAYSSEGRIDYVVFDFRARGTSQLRVSWRGEGGARQGVRNGRVSVGFAERGKRRFRIAVRACRRNRCSRVRRFSGRFRIVRRSTDPPQEETQPNTEAEVADGIPTVPVPAPPFQPPGTAQPGTPVSAPSP